MHLTWCGALPSTRIVCELLMLLVVIALRSTFQGASSYNLTRSEAPLITSLMICLFRCDMTCPAQTGIVDLGRTAPLLKVGGIYQQYSSVEVRS
jgi:hypothetical protein